MNLLDPINHTTASQSNPIYFSVAEHSSEMISSPKEAAAYFPQTMGSVAEMGASIKQKIEQTIQSILAIPAAHKNFRNTFYAIDNCQAQLHSKIQTLRVVALTHNCQKVRDEARRVRDDLRTFFLIQIQSNRKLHQVYQNASENIRNADLTEQEKSYVDAKLSSILKDGFYLSESDFELMKDLKTQMTALETEFLKNLDEDKSHFWVEENELQGIPSHVLDRLERQDGLFKVTCDYPTYYPIMENCLVESTRKRIYIAFNSRGGERNEKVLQELVACRDRLAVLLGYTSFAEYDIEDQMAKTPQAVGQFIDKIVTAAQIKANQEMDRLVEYQPECLSVDGKIKPWDLHFLYTKSASHLLQFDEIRFNEYFPCNRIIDKLLDLYSDLFQLEFKRVSDITLWDPSAFMLEVHDRQTTKHIGFILLDLFPREGKYSHCCCVDVLSPVKTEGGSTPGIAVVLANITPDGPSKPSLLNFDDVLTLFHELGHAMHQLLGLAEMPSLSGYHTKGDFLELPSLLMEELLSSPEILGELGEHYLTKEPISPELIQARLASKRHESGYFNLDQMIKARISLEYFQSGANKNLKMIREEIEACIMPRVAVSSESNYERTFRHLADTMYRSKYYSYHWAEVFAKDVYKSIVEKGSEGWMTYRRHILEAGGGTDPNQLLEGFLGRPPSLQTFLDLISKK